MTEARNRTAERLREALATEIVTEKAMFGAQCFMVGGKLAVCANKDGSLLARVDPERQDEFLARPGASIFEMGHGRLMGPSWLRVDPSVVAADEALNVWMADVLDFNRRITG